jgi:hypothetical protein
LKVTVDLDPAKTTVADMASAEGLSAILARVLFQVAVIVEEVPTGPVRRELQTAYDARPGQRPRLQDVTDRINTEDKAASPAVRRSGVCARGPSVCLGADPQRPASVDLAHSCGTRRCCNPDHLEVTE